MVPRFKPRASPQRRRFGLTGLCLTAAASVSMAPALRAEETSSSAIRIERPWARATPNGAKVAAGYLTIHNDSDAPDRLIRVTSEAAHRIAPHTMSMAAGVMQMRPLPDIVIAPHATVTLQPGADHLMLEELARPLKQGDRFAATLSFDRAGEIPVTFSVEGIGAQAPAGALPP